MTIQMKAIEQYFPVVLFIMLYKEVLTFWFVDGLLKCDHSNESCRLYLLIWFPCFSLIKKKKRNV